MSSKEYRLIADLPLNEARDFNFDRIVDTLLRFITNEQNSTPLNICIDGTWGSGKTSLMKTLQCKLEDQSARMLSQKEFEGTVYVPLWFEPWKLADEQEVLNSLVNLVLRKIQDDAGLIASANVEVDRKDALRILSQRFLQINPDDVSAYYQWSSRLNGSFAEVEDLFHRVTKAYIETGKVNRRFVVFIDDLDRCPPTRVVSVLETVKLFFNMTGFLFVFGMDKAQIEKSVRETYEHFEDGDARIYLEKMFQLTYSLPVKDRESLANFVSLSMREMGLEVEDTALLQALVDTFGRNLRNLKLFLNSFNFQRHLIGGKEVQFSDEVLFKWLFIETTLPASMELAVRSSSLGLLVALEFLSQGAVLYDSERYNMYRTFLSRERIQYFPLIVWSLLPPPEEGDKYDDSRLKPEQKRFVNALRRDGKASYTLNILREGNVFLLDQNLVELAFLTRMETLDQDMRARVDSKELGILAEFESSFILSKTDWNSQGDKFYDRQDYKSAYYAYLLALLMDFSSAIYWTDVGTVYRKFGYTEAALAFFKRAYQLDSQSKYLFPQLAMLYDIDEDDDYHASLFYRKAIALGSSSTVVRYSLSLNMYRLGDYERAFIYALEAFRLDPEDRRRRLRAQQFGAKVGIVDLDFEEWNDGLADVLQKAEDQGLIPYPLSEDEEQAIASFIADYPEIDQVKDQILSGPM